MTRRDGRKDNELRDVGLVYEGLDRVDGSARFSFGTTSSLVSVSGPIEVRLASELPSQATLDVHIRPIAGLPGTESKALSSILKSVLTPSLLLSQSPRTLVQVVGQALCGNETGGGSGSAGRGWNASLVSTLINASTAAFLSASSVPMKGVVCAVAVGRLANPNSPQVVLILDPSEAELPLLAGSGCFAFLFSSALGSPEATSDSEIPTSSLVWTNYTAVGSPFRESEFAGAQQLAEAGAVEVWRKLRESVKSMGHGRSTISPMKQEQNVKRDEESGGDEESMEI